MKTKLHIVLIFILSLVCLMLPQADVLAETTNQIRQFGITWTFNKEYEYGQFANRDYWVVGSVTIIGIDPPSISGGREMNGAMINPSPWKYYDGPGGPHGFDSNLGNYDSSYNVALDVSASNPLVVPPDSSLVSVISDDARDPGEYSWLDDMAVLTVLSEAPPANSFRPAYCGDDKTIKFNVNVLDYNLLGTLEPVATVPDINTVAGWFQRPWLDYWSGNSGRYFHPSNNMPEYGREVSEVIGIGALMLNSDFTNAQKETLMIRFVQLGIDLYGIIADGGEQVFIPDGGHGGGRKWPILFAGLVLNDNDMKNIGQKSGDYLYSDGYGAGNMPPDYIHFGEDSQTFYVKDADVYTAPYELQYRYISHGYGTTEGYVKVTSGNKIVEGVGTNWLATLIDPDGVGFDFGVEGDNQAYSPTGRAYEVDTVDSDTQITLKTNYTGATNLTGTATYKISDWLAYGHGAKSNRLDYDEYVSEHLVLPEFGQRHAAIPSYDGLEWDEAAYRITGTAASWQGQILSALIMGAKDVWNHDALFDYEDRYMAEQLVRYGRGSYLRVARGGYADFFIEDMWDTYRADYGSVWTPESESDSDELENEIEDEILAGKTSLKCYNNVFNPTKGEKALIVVELQKQAHVKISLYNTRGNRIRELADEEKDADVYQHPWDGKNDSGSVVGSGLYFVHIQAGDYKKTKKIVVVK